MGPAPEERQTVYDALLSSARRAVQRAKSYTGRRTRASLLEGLDLRKSFKGRPVVDHVSVRVEQGEIVGLLGPNGAGKTTTFYLITGLISRTRAVLLDGVELTDAPMYQRARSGIGYLAQEPSIFRRMTVEENILAILETRPINREERPAAARSHAGRVVHQASAKEPGIFAQRRRAAPSGDNPGTGVRSQVHAPGRARRRRSDCGA